MAIKVGSIGKYLKKLKVPQKLMSEETEASSQEMAEELARRRESKVASGGLAVHPAADMSDAEIDSITKGKAGPADMGEPPLSREQRDAIKAKYGIGKKGKPSVKEIEAEVKPDADLIAKGREMFPELADQDDAVIESMMKYVGRNA